MDWMWDVRKRGVENDFRVLAWSVEEQRLPLLKLEKLGEDREEQFGRGDIRCLTESVLRL